MKILVPLDGSERTLDALKQASEAFPSGEFHYLTVSDTMPGDRQEQFAAHDDEIHVGPDAVAAVESAQAIQPGAHLDVHGSHAKIIVEKSGEFDVLVMHGLDKPLEELARFSSAAKIARAAQCAVYLANC